MVGKSLSLVCLVAPLLQFINYKQQGKDWEFLELIIRSNSGDKPRKQRQLGFR